MDCGDSEDGLEGEKDIMAEYVETHSEVMLIEEQVNEEEIIEEIEVMEEETVFNNSWIGQDILPFFTESCSFNPKVAQKTPLETVGEVTFEHIGETSTDDIHVEEADEPHGRISSTSIQTISQKTQLETLGEVSLEYVEENIGEIEDSPNIEEVIFENQLIMFAAELHIAIDKQSSSEDLEFISSYFTFMKFGRIFEKDASKAIPLQIAETLAWLKEHLKESRKDIPILKENKRKSIDMIIDAFDAMKNRNIVEVHKLLEDAKKRLDKDFKSGENSLKEKVINTKISIFVESLLKCYNPEKCIFLPTDLIPDIKKEKIVKKIRKHLLRLNESVGRKKSDSQWKKFGKATIEKNKESPAEMGLMYNILKCSYPIYSEASNFTSSVRLIQTNLNFQIQLDTSFLPRGEENHTVLCPGTIMDNFEEKGSDETVFEMDSEGGGEESDVTFTPVYLFAWKTQSSVCLRSKQLLFETYLDTSADVMNIELCFDDNHELDTVQNCGSVGGPFECKINIPACVKADLLEQVRSGIVKREQFIQMKKLGKFYLENAFQYNFYELDGECRSVVHYLAWIGQEEPLADMLEVMPTFANLQDEYGETPLMLTVRGGKPCIAALKILLSSPHVFIDCQNKRGQTALHLAASCADQTCTELLVRGGACVSLRDKQGFVPSDVVPGGLKESQRKLIMGIMKKQKTSK